MDNIARPNIEASSPVGYSKYIVEITEEKFGARGPKVEEPLGLALEYPFQWREPRFDLAMLAKQRRVEKLAPNI